MLSTYACLQRHLQIQLGTGPPWKNPNMTGNDPGTGSIKRTVDTPVGTSSARFAVDGIHCSAHGCTCAGIDEAPGGGACLAWCAQCTLNAKMYDPHTGFDRCADPEHGDDCSVCTVLSAERDANGPGLSPDVVIDMLAGAAR